jgi:3-hydroxybutyryl-CoA dehydrogenase
MDRTTAEAANARLSWSGGLEAAKGSELIIEAVPESVALKAEIYRGLSPHLGRDAWIATNTSSLSITELAATSDRAPRFLGMHFFNPVHRMRLVELVRGLETTDEALAVGEEVAKAMGKETVLVRESPGFVTTRVNALIGNEAFTMLEAGVASARDIDKALKLGLNHPMGPFELVDLVGLDTRLSILEYLHRSLGEKYRPAPLLVQYVKAGRLGRKVGRGVYEYPS